MRTIKIYKSYGVLAHEKQPVYTVSNPASDIYDVITVGIPVKTWENQYGEIGVTLDGEDYLLSDVITNRGDAPVMRWYDGRNERWMGLEVMPE